MPRINNALYTLSHWSNYLLIASGVIYGVLKYTMQVESEYGLRPHEWQGFTQGLHIVISPLMVFSLGSLWWQHILKMKENSKMKRRSGLSMLYLSIPMILTGYFIQVFYQPTLKEVFIWGHVLLSIVWTLLYVIHHFLGRRRSVA
jgi:hypothetical protein